MKILVVDDNDCELYTVLFKGYGIEAVCFNDGVDALKYLEEADNVDAVILDLAMPTLDGLSVAQEIRRNEELHSNRQPVRIAFHSARDMERDSIKKVMLETRVEKLYPKPLAGTNLAEEVMDWLNGETGTAFYH